MTGAVVMGVGASHTTLMNTRWDEVDHLDRAHAFRDALGAARSALTAARPDVCVIIGSNHFRGMWLDLMPPFTVGVDAVSAVGEHGTPSGSLPTRPDVARALHAGLLDRSFDVAMSTDMEVDHGISHAVQYVVPEGAAIVPVVINAFGPPLPTLRRCQDVGTALRAAVADLPDATRVAVIATGGLSHTIPFPDWRSAEGEAEEFFAHTFRHGRGRWREFEEQRRPLVVGAEPRINEAFDADLLDLLEAGKLDGLADRLTNDDVVAVAGNGGNEIRAWLAMAAALGHAPGRCLAYSPMPEWLTGMAVAVLDPNQETSAP